MVTVVVTAIVVSAVALSSRLLLVAVGTCGCLDEELVVSGQRGDISITLCLDSTSDLGEIRYSNSEVACKFVCQ